MSLNRAKNEIRFNVILKALDSREHIQEQLSNVDSVNSEITDKYLAGLFTHTNEVNTILRATGNRGTEYRTLLSHSSELESIVYITHKLNECLDDPSRHHEAIEMLELVDYLHKKHAHDIPLIEVVYKQSERQRDYLISVLCNRLEHLTESNEENVRLIVSYLVRCGNFSDRDLRLKYLQARDNWFNNRCDEHSGSFDDVVSVYCKGLPMIFKEYDSIFGNSNEIHTQKMVTLSTSDTTKEDGAIINSWLLLKASIFISSLEVYLKNINQSTVRTPTMISDTMDKCFELTNWLASIGFDFSSQLIPLFSQALIKEVKSSIERATGKFEVSFTGALAKSIESLLLPVDDEILRISNMKPEEQLPNSIEHYPIFKVYCLYIIDSLRWLQTTRNTFSPISLCTETYASLNASLNRVVKALSVILNMENNSSHPILNKITLSFTTEVLPFFTTYCKILFPEKVILGILGLSKAEFKVINLTEPEKLRNFYLDLSYITEPLKGVLPALVKIVEF